MAYYSKFNNLITLLCQGVLFTDGSIWSQNRRFTLRHLKAFGLGQSTMVQQLHTEAHSLIEFLKLQSNKGAVAMHTAFDVSVLNSLWQMFAGRRFDHDDEKVNDILDVVHEVFRLVLIHQFFSQLCDSYIPIYTNREHGICH